MGKKEPIKIELLLEIDGESTGISDNQNERIAAIFQSITQSRAKNEGNDVQTLEEMIKNCEEQIQFYKDNGNVLYELWRKLNKEELELQKILRDRDKYKYEDFERAYQRQLNNVRIATDKYYRESDKFPHEDKHYEYKNEKELGKEKLRIQKFKIELEDDEIEKKLKKIELDYENTYKEIIEKREKYKEKSYGRLNEEETRTFDESILANDELREKRIDRLFGSEKDLEKRIELIKEFYVREISEIGLIEERLRGNQHGEITTEQEEQLSSSLERAHQNMVRRLEAVKEEEVGKNREKLDALLDQYKDYDQQRRELEKSYTEDMEILNAELLRQERERLDTTEIKSAISARENAYSESIGKLQRQVLQSSGFYDKLFGNVADKGYKVLKDFYQQAEETLKNAKMLKDGVQISVTVKDADGKFVKRAVKLTMDEYRRMLKQVQEIRKQLDKDNPFASLKRAWSDFIKATKEEDGDVGGALKELNARGKEVTATIRGWGEDLGDVFGNNFKNSMNEILTFCDGLMDTGTGIAQIWSGDIVGGITNVLGGLGSIFSMFSSWKEKMEEMKREWYIAEIETNRALRERTAIYAANRSQISDIISDTEMLDWLVREGYAKPSSVSVWDAESASLNEYIRILREETKVYDELWNKLQDSQGHYEWGNSLNGGSASWSLKGYNSEMIELWYNQGKLSDEAKAYYEAWVESGKTVEELIQNIEECKNSMREMVMGVSFDSFLSNAKDALKEMRGDISKLGEFTEDTLANAIMNGFMYRELASVLEPLYNELSDAFIDGNTDATYLEEWRKRFEEIMTAAGDRLGEIADAAGIDLGKSNDSNDVTKQAGRSGGFNAMSQDQGTKLEGLFVSVQMHTASIDEQMEDVSDKMSQASEHLRKIEENTRKTADKIEKVSDNIEKIIRDGIKTR